MNPDNEQRLNLNSEYTAAPYAEEGYGIRLYTLADAIGDNKTNAPTRRERQYTSGNIIARTI